MVRAPSDAENLQPERRGHGRGADGGAGSRRGGVGGVRSRGLRGGAGLFAGPVVPGGGWRRQPGDRLSRLPAGHQPIRHRRLARRPGAGLRRHPPRRPAGHGLQQPRAPVAGGRLGQPVRTSVPGWPLPARPAASVPDGGSVAGHRQLQLAGGPAQPAARAERARRGGRADPVLQRPRAGSGVRRRRGLRRSRSHPHSLRRRRRGLWAHGARAGGDAGAGDSDRGAIQPDGGAELPHPPVRPRRVPVPDRRHFRPPRAVRKRASHDVRQVFLPGGHESRRHGDRQLHRPAVPRSGLRRKRNGRADLQPFPPAHRLVLSAGQPEPLHPGGVLPAAHDQDAHVHLALPVARALHQIACLVAAHGCSLGQAELEPPATTPGAVALAINGVPADRPTSRRSYRLPRWTTTTHSPTRCT